MLSPTEVATLADNLAALDLGPAVCISVGIAIGRALLSDALDFPNALELACYRRLSPAADKTFPSTTHLSRSLRPSMILATMGVSWVRRDHAAGAGAVYGEASYRAPTDIGPRSPPQAHVLMGL